MNLPEYVRYTSKIRWPDNKYIVGLDQFRNEHGDLPPDGQWVPQVVIDKLAMLEDEEEYDRRELEQMNLDDMISESVVVVHGHWIDKPSGPYGRMQSWCSACGNHSGIGGIESNRHKPYCPNCGAKMDEDKQDADY